MNYKRQGLRALGLSILAALGLMAFMAAGAQADKGEWLILTKNDGLLTLKQTAVPSESITGEQENEGENLLQVLGLNIRLYCEKVHVTGASILPLGHGKATLEFLECKLTDSAGNPNKTCLVANIATNVLALLINDPNPSSTTHRWILFSPLTGTTFVTPLFHDVAPEECSVTAAPITGSVVASMNTKSKEHTTDIEGRILISTKNTLDLFPADTLKFGQQVSHLKADALVRLNGNEAKQAWGYHLL